MKRVIFIVTVVLISFESFGHISKNEAWDKCLNSMRPILMEISDFAAEEGGRFNLLDVDFNEYTTELHLNRLENLIDNSIHKDFSLEQKYDYCLNHKVEVLAYYAVLTGDFVYPEGKNRMNLTVVFNASCKLENTTDNLRESVQMVWELADKRLTELIKNTHAAQVFAGDTRDTISDTFFFGLKAGEHYTPEEMESVVGIKAEKLTFHRDNDWKNGYTAEFKGGLIVKTADNGEFFYFRIIGNEWPAFKDAINGGLCVGDDISRIFSVKKGYPETGDDGKGDKGFYRLFPNDVDSYTVHYSRKNGKITEIIWCIAR